MTYDDVMAETIALTVRVTPEVHDILRLFSYLTKLSINETVLQCVKQSFSGSASERFEEALSAFRADPRVTEEDLARMLGTVEG